MILIASNNFPFNFIFTSDNFRILAPIYFTYINHFIYFKIDFRIKICLIVEKMILKKL